LLGELLQNSAAYCLSLPRKSDAFYILLHCTVSIGGLQRTFLLDECSEKIEINGIGFCNANVPYRRKKPALDIRPVTFSGNGLL
jgi:hypothetical protein